MSSERYEYWSDAVFRAYSQALAEWKGEYYRMESPTDVFAMHIRRITVAQSHLPGGVILVRIVVHPRRAWQREEYFYRFTQVAGHWHVG